jgi:aminoglycoside phosphotransferase (APT) family kinase protein
MIYGEQPPATVRAILDWEMATIGDPLADLGYLALNWVGPDDPPGLYEDYVVTRAPGFCHRAELVERYAEGSGRAVGDLRWYHVLAAWKSVAFMEGNYRRAATGLSDDPFLKGFGDGVVQLAEQAQELALGTGLA